jgi:hypothetical protein
VLQASIGVSDGQSLWAVRYSTAGRSRTLFTSADVNALQALHPENPRLQRMHERDSIVGVRATGRPAGSMG